MIFRTQHNKENPYFMLNRAAVEDDRLSFKAVGIINYLLSKPDKWVVQEADLINRHTDGGTAIRSGMAELKKYGYFKKVAVFDEATHRIIGWETHVFETPQDEETHNVENPPSGNSTLWKTDPLVSNDSLVSNDFSFSDEKDIHPEPEQKPSTSVGPKKENTKSSRKPKEDCAAAEPVTPPLPTEHQQGFEAVCICVGWDYKVITKEQAGQVAQTWGILTKAGYTLDDLREFYRHWKYHDWRGLKGQFPTLSQLRSEIGKVKNLDKSVMNGNGNGNGNGASMSRKVREL